ncbi:isocitrate lyase/phosphoenolpyruvate mutase family protein, partial [Streptomyces sp. NPDC059680]|uniref:isocitrate lyase/phosphoenolpyruvate mutase family protein n=1 Tax=Streptomyces sp. NPDC059680 TaxID=3346904 RepID=UPI00369C61FF
MARIAAVVRVPVGADIEAGYATDPAGVADAVRAVLAAGAVGVDIEDARHEAGLPHDPGAGGGLPCGGRRRILVPGAVDPGTVKEL